MNPRYDCALAATHSALEWLQGLEEDDQSLAAVQALLPLLGGESHNQAVSSLIDVLFPHEALNAVEELAMAAIVLLVDMADWDEIREALKR